MSNTKEVHERKPSSWTEASRFLKMMSPRAMVRSKTPWAADFKERILWCLIMLNLILLCSLRVVWKYL